MIAAPPITMIRFVILLSFLLLFLDLLLEVSDEVRERGDGAALCLYRSEGFSQGRGHVFHRSTADTAHHVACTVHVWGVVARALLMDRAGQV